MGKPLLPTLWLLRSLFMNCNILFRKEVSDLNKFSASMRLLCSGRRCLPGLKPCDRKNQQLDLRLSRTDLCCFLVAMLRGIIN
jgi:hypothetical protein